ncbi:hypothetical protein K493DRAFT_362724 [Basidiobolus meristosporus CBS 931.73]|uniref:Arrestin C-terminal-like domain-containing protein n=1 Tax=Basidiobolus meristosporus CBS 931.73 TaxID=1314790 RepID=A0A1Y1X091_9FUNG|nr:hypothetical protein K493DRAFT_362724 [Basidiobolus meristosporus CBS 931.73]|eukprot:ORX79112.1 hypothetical protein K493DRAFT_362724 [Basidiobolus meristosporus CBS 931.73]
MHSPRIEIRLPENHLILHGRPSESAGCVLRGSLVLNLPSSQRIKKISLNFSGRVRLSWPEGQCDFVQRTHSVRRTVVDHTWTFLDATKKSKSLSSGQHVYDFELPLSGDIPETVRTEHGAIEYELIAHVERPKFYSNYSASRDVLIKRQVPSTATELMQSVVIADHWEEKLAYEFFVPCKAFGEGESITVSYRLRPLVEGLQVQRVSCALKEYVRYESSDSSAHRINSHQICFDEDTQPRKIAELIEKETTVIVPKALEMIQYDCETDLIQIRHKLKAQIEVVESDGTVTKILAAIPILIIPGTLEDALDCLPRYELGIPLPDYESIVAGAVARLSLLLEASELPPTYEALNEPVAPTISTY